MCEKCFWGVLVGFFLQCSLLQKTIQLENAIFNANLIIIRMRVLQTEIFFIFFFGFQKNGCLCLSDNNIHFISESGKFNLSYWTSLSKCESGGIGYISMYESMNVSLPDAHFGVFCLTCRQQSNSNKTLLYSTGCNDKEASFCVKSNGEVLSLQPIMSSCQQ